MNLGTFQPRPAQIAPPKVVKDAPQLRQGEVDIVEVAPTIEEIWTPDENGIPRKSHNRKPSVQVGRGVVKR